MKFYLVPVSTVGIKHKELLCILENNLSTFFESKSYGEDLKEVYIHLIVVSPHLRRFFKLQKPVYISDRTYHIRNIISSHTEKAFKYSIELNFELFNNAGEARALEMLKTELLHSLSFFGGFKNRLKDFNTVLFRQDFTNFFKQISVQVAA